MSYFVKEIFYTLSTIERKTIGLSELVMRSRPSFFASSHAFGVALLKAESRSSSGAIIERSAPRTSEGVGDEGGLIWGSKLVGGNQIVKNKDFPPNQRWILSFRPEAVVLESEKLKDMVCKDISRNFAQYSKSNIRSLVDGLKVGPASPSRGPE